jgi:diguanylate cyclase (GGDEF)-like protein/PAS domain S-box-containing protein
VTDSAADPPAAAACLLEGLPDAAWLVDIASQRVVAANRAAHQLFGRADGSLPGEHAQALAASPEDLAWWDQAHEPGVPPLHSDTVVCTPDARLLHVSRSIRRLPVAAGAGSGSALALVVLADRSAEQRAETAREELLAELQATLEATADGILVTDLAGRVRAFNRRFAEIWGVPLELLQDRQPHQPENDRTLREWMSRSVADTAAYERRLRALERAALIATTDRIELENGSVLERVTRPLLHHGRAQGRVWSFRDLTERLAQQERIEALSLNDSLTGLANRRHLTDRVERAVADARQSGKSLALLVVDLDRFRHINDSLGHDMGDRVLLDVARRIQGCLRSEDLLARLSGDQFAVLVTPADAAAAEATAKRVLNVVAQPCNVEGAQFTLTCSIGVALAPSHGNTADELVRHAEAAMRAVKDGGRANWRLHQARAEVDRRSHMKLDHAMRQALVSGRFRLAYQPQVNLADGRVTGAEALLRWRDPEMGEVPPGRFIPVAEDSGFIVPIGDWVLSQAVRQAALWHSRGLAMPVAVNVSALQFEQAHFVDRVASVLAVSGLPPALLELELTESILVHDADEALHRLHALARLGVKMSIDDFGTGYSSLAYLKRFPIDKLKIDRSFVKGLPDDDSDAGIVRAILQMARALGKTVIAEGVETEAQRQFLFDAGCDEFQGFLFAPALDALSFERRWPAAAAAAEVSQPAPRIRLVRSSG